MKKNMSKDKEVVVLDTNTLSSNPKRNSANFKALLKLSKNNKIDIKLPYIVKMEFVTQQIEKCKEFSTSYRKLQTDIDKQSFSPNDIFEKSEDINKDILQKCENIEKEFDLWCEEYNIDVLPLNTNDTENVFQSYFNAQPPFKTLKSRKDIPDAFIYENIKKLCKDYNIHFVCNDKNLKDFLDKEGIKTYSSIGDLLKEPSFQDILLEHFIEKDKFEELKQFIGKNDTTLMLHISKSLTNEIIYKEVYSKTIPNDDHLASIIAIDEPEILYLNINNIFYLGDKKIAIPFSSKLDATLEFAIYKSDYYAYDYDFSITDLNEHYYEAEIDKTLLLNGLAVLEISIKDLNELLLKDSIDDEILHKTFILDNIKLDSIDINIVNSSISEFYCKDCDTKYLLNCDELEWNSIDGTERGMGPEIHYQAEYINSCLCGNDMIIYFNCWEYPIGAINYIDIEATGVYKIENNCCIDTNKGGIRLCQHT